MSYIIVETAKLKEGFTQEDVESHFFGNHMYFRGIVGTGNKGEVSIKYGSDSPAPSKFLEAIGDMCEDFKYKVLVYKH